MKEKEKKEKREENLMENQCFKYICLLCINGRNITKRGQVP